MVLSTSQIVEFCEFPNDEWQQHSMPRSPTSPPPSQVTKLALLLRTWANYFAWFKIHNKTRSALNCHTKCLPNRLSLSLSIHLRREKAHQTKLITIGSLPRPAFFVLSWRKPETRRKLQSLSSSRRSSLVLSKLILFLFYFILFHFISFFAIFFLFCWEIDSNFLCTFRISYDYATIIINVNFLWPFPLTVATLFFMWRSWSNRGGIF